MNVLSRWFPFSLLSLLIAITVTACYLALIVAVSSAADVWVGVLAVASFPIILIWTNGFLILVRRWQDHPHVSKYALLGLAGLLMSSMLGWLFNILFFNVMNWSPGDIQTLFMIRSCVVLVIRAGCWWLVMIAILGWRDPAPADGKGE